MKTKPTQKITHSYALFFLLLFGMSYSGFSQCPTVNNPAPPPICVAAGYSFGDLNANATDGGDGIVWYDSPTGGNSFNANELVDEGIYYAGNNSGTCVTRMPITIDFIVDASGQNLDRVYCSNENATYQVYVDDVLSASIPANGSVEIYSDLALTNSVNFGDAIPSSMVNHYIVFVDNSGCKGQIEGARIIVSGSPVEATPATSQPFCSDANATIADLDPGTTGNFYWYRNLDGSGDPIAPSLASTEVLENGTYYIQVDNFICVSDPVAVTVAIDDPVNPGTSSSLAYCNDSLPVADFNLFDELGGTKDTTGSWSGPQATSNGHLGTINISSLTTSGDYIFIYTVPSNGVCPDGVSEVTISVFESLSSGNASAANPASFCIADLPSEFDLFSLVENHDLGGQWTAGAASTDPVITSPIDLSGLTAGTYNYTYSQNVTPNPCPENSTTVQVVVLDDPNAGVALNAVFCENDLTANSPYNLFDALDGSQDNNSGTWADSNNNTISNSLDITSLTVEGSPYSFNYTIDNGTCSDTEIITITIEPAPESGTVNPAAMFCEGTGSATFDLFTLLEGEDQTGTWSDDNGTGVLTGNEVDLSGLTPATYNFTFDVDAIGSCDDELVTVQITINPLPETGTPMPATFCENDLVANSPLDLFGQLTGEDAGGTWTDDNSSGALTSSNVDLTALAIGSYNFTYTITDANSCENSSTVTLIVTDAPESGTVNPAAMFCEGTGSATFDLFTLLEGEDQTGTWSDDNGTGVLTGNEVDLSGLPPATYNFTFDVDAIGSCDDELVTVQITINPLPETGTPMPATFCENDLVANSPLDLFGQLTGEEAGGTWTDDNSSGALTSSNVDLTALAIGSYNFTYTITDANSCENSSTVTVIVTDAPESGTVNAPVEFCISEITSGQTYNLFDLLEGEDQTGTWADDNASGALSGNEVTLDGLAAGIYNFTFDVDAIGSCDDELVTVSIIIDTIEAPTADAIQEFCDSATVASLEATGTNIKWYDAATEGNLLDSDTALVDGQMYYASQTDATTGCESTIRTAVTATIYQSPNAGAANATAIISCNDNTSIDLFTGLDGTQDTTGTWQNDDSAGTITGNTLDVTGVSAGTYNYTYLVSASSPCVDDSVTITITIEEPLNAGSNTNIQQVMCSNEGTVDLFTLLGGADTGGTWSPALTSGTGVFDPLVDVDGTFVYTLTNSCGTFTNQVEVEVTLAPNAGENNTLDICTSSDAIDLFTLLGTGAQSGGVWSPELTSTTGVFDPAVDTSGTYIYTVTAVSPCSPDATAEIVVTVTDTPAVGVLDPNPEFCMENNPTVADLSASISATGTANWYDDMALTMPLQDTDSLVDGEDYYVTQTSNGCESLGVEQINVTINDAPTPTLKDSTLEYCINDNPTINTLSDNITEYDNTGDNLRWYDAATGGSAISNNSSLTNTTYYVALVDAATGCESSVRLQVTPDLTACGKLQIPDGFSPNGDGTNDTFDIDNLAILYPNFEIEIFNRNGNVVYKGNANSPRFDGTSNQGRVVSKGDLPVGVYFYIFNYNDGENKPEQGRLYLSR
ncbi:gliding motility-associated C-terminal domain-containing protein [Algibacter pectinivorans]|uniref:Gliding motility-associated C-terminal domain-containing protein n=1 Tax=Algibacter pectinivorans TaxID=870482 RepID=A0A1I1MSJ0_9FLAO|nr:gliding motility-associated C-terminal domain-containing protein [Algibacter pectinivorans]SFC88125.1 gliding motility-associated C-terminal domain-containing protein [Algibacter pectinivorans]